MSGYAATGIGSLPGTHADEATRIVAGELPDLPHVVELPARGPGADMVGRTMSMLAELAPDLAVETTPLGWRFADAPGRVMRRARSWLAEDLDAAEAHYAGSPRVKSQVCGPWTLCAAVEMRNGERAVRDHGACREIASALADAVTEHLRDLRRRLPATSVILQVDEPALPSVLAGGVSTASGIATYRAIDPQVAQAHLGSVVDAVIGSEATAWIHCCAPRPPVDLMRRAGFVGIATDRALSVAGQDTEVSEQLGRTLDEGGTLALGVLDPLGEPSSTREDAHAARIAHRILERLDRWGFSPEAVSGSIVLTPDCGLAGADPQRVRAAYRILREAGRLIRDEGREPA